MSPEEQFENPWNLSSNSHIIKAQMLCATTFVGMYSLDPRERASLHNRVGYTNCMHLVHNILKKQRKTKSNQYPTHTQHFKTELSLMVLGTEVTYALWKKSEILTLRLKSYLLSTLKPGSFLSSSEITGYETGMYPPGPFAVQLIYICPQRKIKVFLTLNGIMSYIDWQPAFFSLKMF